jgi:hypothetical protein
VILNRRKKNDTTMAVINLLGQYPEFIIFRTSSNIDYANLKSAFLSVSVKKGLQ